ARLGERRVDVMRLHPARPDVTRFGPEAFDIALFNRWRFWRGGLARTLFRDRRVDLRLDPLNVAVGHIDRWCHWRDGFGLADRRCRRINARDLAVACLCRSRRDLEV